MEIFQLIASTTIITSAILLVGYLNKRYELDLDGDTSSLWSSSCAPNKTKKLLAEKDLAIEKLTERIQVLEKLVTDPKEQLKREIDRL